MPDPLVTTFLADRHVGCPACGYNLHGANADVCPECGIGLVLSLAATDRKPVRVRRLLAAGGVCLLAHGLLSLIESVVRYVLYTLPAGLGMGGIHWIEWLGIAFVLGEIPLGIWIIRLRRREHEFAIGNGLMLRLARVLVWFLTLRLVFPVVTIGWYMVNAI